MSRQRERDEFIARATKAGIGLDAARKLMRYGTTLQRLAEAQCNGDWPADNGIRETRECERCGTNWASELRAMRESGICPDCRTEDLARRACEGTGWRPVFNGDPRGAVLSIVPDAAKDEDVQSGRERGIYVP